MVAQDTTIREQAEQARARGLDLLETATLLDVTVERVRWLWRQHDEIVRQPDHDRGEYAATTRKGAEHRATYQRRYQRQARARKAASR